MLEVDVFGRANSKNQTILKMGISNKIFSSIFSLFVACKEYFKLFECFDYII